MTPPIINMINVKPYQYTETKWRHMVSDMLVSICFRYSGLSLFGAKPLFKPMLTYCQIHSGTNMKIQWNLNKNKNIFIRAVNLTCYHTVGKRLHLYWIVCWMQWNNLLRKKVTFRYVACKISVNLFRSQSVKSGTHVPVSTHSVNVRCE